LARLSVSRTIDALIEERAKPIWERYPKHTPNRIATTILDQVNKNLIEKNLRPMTANALAKRIRKIRTNT
jgi:hypothetical protein